MDQSLKEKRLPSIDGLRVEWDTRGDVAWDTAISLAEFSILAYTRPHNRQLVLRLVGFDEVAPLDDGPMSGVLAISDDVAVIAFRGTDMFDPRDWLANVDFYQRTTIGDGRQVHRGFQNAYERFSAEIKLRLNRRNLGRVWVTGHSLGGAMAACCAVDLADNGKRLSGLVTYGQPRVGNQALARFFEDRIAGRYVRFVNEDDPAPLLPPGIGALLPAYRHAGARVRFRDGQLERRQRVMLFSAPAPGATATSQPPPVETFGDAETVSEEEFLALQQNLRARQPVDAEARMPSALRSESPRVYENAPPDALALSTARYEGVGRMAIESLLARVNEHSMLEYLRQLNQFAR